MSVDRSLALKFKLTKKGYDPQHVCEVGVYLPETCSVLPFIQAGKKASLVEANPIMVEKIQVAFKDYPNTKVFPYAVGDRPGRLVLYNRGASTFLENVESPALINDQYSKSDKDRFEVEARTFDQIDDGTINLICIDIEGAEWFVLNNLVSKPDLISVETHGKYYLNPRLKDIRDWMKSRGYRVWYKDKSDTVFVKQDVILVTGIEQISNAIYEIYLWMRRMKGYWRTNKI
jgi:FkbM family methyltransferase